MLRYCNHSIYEIENHGEHQKNLKYLANEDWPVTTEMISKELKVSWNTAQVHLYRLLADGLVRYKKWEGRTSGQLQKKVKNVRHEISLSDFQL